MKYPEGTTHMLFVADYMGHWEYWRLIEHEWLYFDTFSFQWQEATPYPNALPKLVDEL